jgi:phytoene dehydrogenase-like protein
METWPNVINSPHAAINFSGGSPIIPDLELDTKYGYKESCTQVVYASVNKDGKGVVMCYNEKLTAKSLEKYSKKDAKRIEEVEGRVNRNKITPTGFTKLVDYTPLPDKIEVVDKIWQLNAEFWDLDVETFKTMTAFDLLEENFETDIARRLLLTLPGLALRGDISAPGQGAMTINFIFNWFSGQAIGGNHTLAHALLRCFLDHGGTLLLGCPVEKIIIKDGEAKGVKLSDEATFPGKIITAEKAVVSAVGVPVTWRLLGEDGQSLLKELDPRLWYRFKYWITHLRASTLSHWVLKGHPKWRSLETEEMIKYAHLLYRNWDSWDHAKRWWRDMTEQRFWEAYDGLCEILDYSIVDPTQISPEGYLAVRAEVAVPIRGPGRWKMSELHKWDEVKGELAAKRDDLFEELAPGWKKQMVSHMYMTPIDIWRYNPSAVYGQVIGGDFGAADQWLADRPPYRMPIKKLYMSLGCWPLTLSWGANGYNCAEIVAEDLGIRNQPWWTHHPWQWFLENLSHQAGLG